MKQAYRHIYSLFKERRKEKKTEERVKEKKSIRSVFRKNGLIVRDSYVVKKKKARKRELNQKSDATPLIYNAVIHTFYNSLIALSTYR